MAYTNSPENSTYRTVNMEFTATSFPRSGDYTIRRDAEVLNMFFDRNSNENQTRSMALTKRPGLEDTAVSLQKLSPSSIVNGYFQDESTGNIYWSVDGKVFERNLGGVTTQIATMSGTATADVNSVGFTSFLTSTGTRYICFCNGTELWYSVPGSGTSTKVTSANLPSNPSKDIVFLDGYLFLFKKETGDIYNSDLDTPANWTAGNYITAEINPDKLLGLTKIKNYIIAFGAEGVEFFYDAANTQGSPLGRNESYYKNVILASNICTVGDTVYFVGRQKNQGLQVYSLDANTLKPISNTATNRILQQYAGVSLDSDLYTPNQLYSGTLNGHNFLFLSILTGVLYVCDLDIGFWYRWTIGSVGPANTIEGIWIFNFTTGLPRIAIGGRSYISNFNNGLYQDFGNLFTASYTTEDYDGGTFNWKSCHRLGLLSDIPVLIPPYSNIQVSWSDDDGLSFSSPRTLNLSPNNPYITQCGRFRNRIWRFEYTDNNAFRLFGCSMDLNIGNI